jgi:hypothetical protein
MKQVCETSVVMAFKYGPFWNSKTPNKILGFNPMELDFGGCQQLVRLGLLLCFPEKKQTNKPMILCVCPFHWVLFSVANQSINQSILRSTFNLIEERNKRNYKKNRVDRIDQISLTKFTSFLFI